MTGKGFCCTSSNAFCFWFALALIFYGIGLVLTLLWAGLDAYQTSVLFVALGLACVVNAAWNRTFHCFITGPLFFLIALALAVVEAGLLAVPETLIWGSALIGTGVAFLLEQRYAA